MKLNLKNLKKKNEYRQLYNKYNYVIGRKKVR